MDQSWSTARQMHQKAAQSVIRDTRRHTADWEKSWTGKLVCEGENIAGGFVPVHFLCFCGSRAVETNKCGKAEHNARQNTRLSLLKLDVLNQGLFKMKYADVLLLNHTRMSQHV